MRTETRFPACGKIIIKTGDMIFFFFFNLKYIFVNEWSSQLEIAEPDTFNLCSIKRTVKDSFLSLIFLVVLFVIR